MTPSERSVEPEERAALLETLDTWPTQRAALALRALGLDPADSRRPSLERIAADAGVSRETVRRARNAAAHAIRSPSRGDAQRSARSSGAVGEERSGKAQQTAGRALRRMLTMTGPLPWDEILNAWARAGGRSPYFSLPDNAAALQEWAIDVGGLHLTPSRDQVSPTVVGVANPSELDRVSAFLFAALKGRPDGVARSELFELAESYGLKSTTIATALSEHPAVVRVGHGGWALRGDLPDRNSPKRVSRAPARRHNRPTSFHWEAGGALTIEFSVPSGPSPVIAVPRAISEVIEGREFECVGASATARIAVRNARLWGFGTLLSEAGVTPGDRVRLRLGLLDGRAQLVPHPGKGDR